jgi:prevent-host-death family protein
MGATRRCRLVKVTLPKTTHQLSAAQAQSRLADCLRKVEHGERVIITRNGKPVAALVAAHRVTLQKPKNALTGTGLAGLAGGWKGSENLVRALGKLRRTRPRRPITLD